MEQQIQHSGTLGSRYLSLAIDMAGLRCLVVGGGSVGTRKALKLAAAGAGVTVVSPEVSDRLREAAAAGRIQWRQAEYDAAQLGGFMLVVAATADLALNARIGHDAEARGLLCCDVSAGASSQVIFPAVHEAGALTVAVHSHGRDCRLSKQIRDELAAWLQQ